MSARCQWLYDTQDHSKHDIPGKKYFKIHKNIHNIQLAPTSITPVNNRNLTPTETSPVRIKTPAKLDRRRFRADLPNIGQEIIRKDSEIENLRRLYQEASTRLRIIESKSHIQENLVYLSSAKKLPTFELSPTSKPKVYSPTPFRNKSTENYQLNKLERSLNQVKFTKNRPKIVMGNPITGLPLNYS